MDSSGSAASSRTHRRRVRGSEDATGNAAVPAKAAARRKEPQDMRQLSPQDWVIFALDLLGSHGPDAVRIDRLCAGLGVTKGSFYWHFKSRADLTDRMLKHWQYQETQAIIDDVEAKAQRPDERLSRLFEKANAGTVNFRAEMAIRQWALQDKLVAATVQAVDDMRMDFLQRQFAALGFTEPGITMRARLLYSLILGEALIQQPEPRSQRHARTRDSLRYLLKR